MSTFSSSLPSPPPPLASSSSSFFASSSLHIQVPPAASPRHQRPRLARRGQRSHAPGTTVLSASMRDDPYGADSGGWLVDEDMIVLRKRLHEMQMAETNFEPPPNWMDWEKRYYARYDADVCHFVGMLQAFLLNTRPSVALGLLALVTISVPTSASVVVLKLVAAMKTVLPGVHLG